MSYPILPFLEGFSNSYIFNLSQKQENQFKDSSSTYHRTIPFLTKITCLTNNLRNILVAAPKIQYLPSVAVFDGCNSLFNISMLIATIKGVTDIQNGSRKEALQKTIQIAYAASTIALAILQPAYGVAALGVLTFEVMNQKGYIPSKISRIVEQCSPAVLIISMLFSERVVTKIIGFTGACIFLTSQHVRIKVISTVKEIINKFWL